MPNSAVASHFVGAEKRRSERIQSVIPMEVYWAEPGVASVSEPAETEVINAHGALLQIRRHLPIPPKVHLRCSRTGMSSEARVVAFREPTSEGKLRMAVELAVPSQTFWGVEIPPIQPWAIPRKHPRVPLVTQVESRATGAVSLGHTDNISVDGLFVLTPDTFDPGTEVIVRFNLRSGRPIEAAGNVVHSVCGVRMGIQFRRLKDEDRDMIAKFIQQASEEE